MHQRATGPALPVTISRRGAWITLVVGLIIGLALIGGLRSLESPHHDSAPPAGSESAAAAEVLEQLPGRDVSAVLLVATHDDGAALTAADLAGLTRRGADLALVPDAQVGPAIASADGRAAMVAVAVPVSESGGANRETIEDLRTTVAAATGTTGAELVDLTIDVTGGPAFGVDLAATFDGADFRLLAATIGIVALLLIVTYRSPILWLIPLLVVGLADQVSAGLTALLARELGIGFDSGVVSVLVFGAGTNYALLLISRYREELSRRSDHRVALATALRASLAPILASNLTVVLALGTLLLAVVPNTRGLGIASAAGLLVALAFALLVLPAALAVCGPRLFWPFIPRTGQTANLTDSVFGRVAATVLKRPLPILVGSVLVLGILGGTLIGTPVGLQQSDRFATQTESARGLDTLGAHFPAGNAQPLLIVTDPTRAEQVTTALEQVDEVDGVRPDVTDGSVQVLSVVIDPEPGTAQARSAIEDVREAVHEVDPDALVGGVQAEELDLRQGSIRDLILVAPIILIVIGIVLMILLRSVVAPIALLAVNTLSSLGAIGAGVLIGMNLLGWPAIDLAVPLFAFLFLIALGIDYTMFLMHRALAEARQHGTRAGLVRAVGATGGVITSAGVVLAGVFAALGVLPLVTLGQVGLIVGIGVLIDALIVRTVVLPALIGVLGDRIWWPARPHTGAAVSETSANETAVGRGHTAAPVGLSR